jgi:hypothetical protein
VPRLVKYYSYWGKHLYDHIILLWREVWANSTTFYYSWPWSYDHWICHYLCNQCLSPLMLWVRISIRERRTTLCDPVCQWLTIGLWISPALWILFVCLKVFSATFNNVSVISWRSVLLVEVTGGSGEIHRPIVSHWQIGSHNVVHLSPIEIRTHNISGDICNNILASVWSLGHLQENS